MNRFSTVHPITYIVLIAILSFQFRMEIIQMPNVKMVVLVLLQIYQAQMVLDFFLMMDFIANYLIAHQI
jgi:hypothetical protein